MYYDITAIPGTFPGGRDVPAVETRFSRNESFDRRERATYRSFGMISAGFSRLSQEILLANRPLWYYLLKTADFHRERRDNTTTSEKKAGRPAFFAHKNFLSSFVR